MVLNDRVLGIVALLVAFFLFWFGYSLKAPFSYEPVGPNAFPVLISIVIALCGVVLLIKGGNAVLPNTKHANLRILGMVVCIALYAFLFQFVGFIVSTAVMCILIGRLFGGTWLKVSLGGIVMAFVFYGLFDMIFEVTLPIGTLWE